MSEMLFVYQDVTKSNEERAVDLLARMTVAEKVAQLGSYWIYELLDGRQFSPLKAQRCMRNGVGHITRVAGASNAKPRESADLANALQKWLLENTRLAIPALVHEECCSGFMARGATVFPQSIGMASTWQPELVQAMAEIIRLQMRAVGGHQALSPVLDVTRDARWGRVEETFGEDPYLISQMGIAFIRGMQGENLHQAVLATGKHFVGYGMSEGGMNWAPAHLAPRELRETYLLPFEAAVREAQLASIMNGYHELDGLPCGANRWLLTDVLRDEWGFKGTVVSDYLAVEQLETYHKIAPDLSQAAAMALEAGIDIELPSTRAFGEPLMRALDSGDVPLELVDQAVKRLLQQKFQLGLFEQPFVDASLVVFDTPDQRRLARETAHQSIVLLRNEGSILPLTKTGRSLAVIGPNADSVRNLFGDYSYPAQFEDLMKASQSNTDIPRPETSQTIDDFVAAKSLLETLRSAADLTCEIHYARGCDVLHPSTEGFSEAVAAAQRADIALVVVGDKAGLLDDCTSGETCDRAIIDLPGVQQQLVEAIYNTGTPIILVLINGRPVTLNWMAEKIPAILECWLPGEEGAAAIKDVLFGDVNPGGKLPISFPQAVGQVPVFYSHRPSGGRSHWKGKYVETSTRPLYPFGYGLSYTQFAFDHLRMSERGCAGDTLRIHVDVTNIGTRRGDEVVQVYTHQKAARITRPVKELRAFQRVTLDPSETKTITFYIPVNLLAFMDHQESVVVAPGQVEVMVGSSSDDIHLQGVFTIEGDVTPVQRAYTSVQTIGKSE